MKKTWLMTMVLALIMSLLLSACGGSNSGASQGTNGQDSGAPAKTGEAQPSKSEAADDEAKKEAFLRSFAGSWISEGWSPGYVATAKISDDAGSLALKIVRDGKTEEVNVSVSWKDFQSGTSPDDTERMSAAGDLNNGGLINLSSENFVYVELPSLQYSTRLIRYTGAEIAEKYVGTWTILEKPDDMPAEFTITKDGCLSYEGNAYTLAEQTGNTHISGDLKYEQVYGALENGFVKLYELPGNDNILLVDLGSGNSRIYIKDRTLLKDILPEDLLGSWTVINKPGYQWNGAVIGEINITEELTIQINGQELALYFDSLPGEDTTELFWRSADDKLSGFYRYPSEDKGSCVYLAVNGSDVYCVKNAEKVELTADNWQDYFHAEVSYEARTDQWGEVYYVSSLLQLVPNEGVVIYDTMDELIEVSYTLSDFAVVTYNTAAGIFSTREMTAEEKTIYQTYIESTQPTISRTNTVSINWPSNKDNRWRFYITSMGYDKDGEYYAVNGDTVTCPQPASFEAEVTRAKGTLFVGK